MASSALRRARKAKRDEFYTRIEDVKKELDHYKVHFEGKIVYLNCDDPKFSAFWEYFRYNFDLFGLKKLIATYYISDGSSSYKYEYGYQDDTNELKVVKTKLKGDGDFRSEECIELLKEADIIATNPPFSLWREYLAQLVEYDKQFVILGNMGAIAYKEVFPLFKNNEIWYGHQPMSSQFLFEVPDDYEYEHVVDGRKLKSMNATWYTNLEINKRCEDLELTRFYEGNEEHYPIYDNYDAIEVSKVKEIPMDYEGMMGVPITFMDKHNPEQFDILGSDNYEETPPIKSYGKKKRVVDGVVKKSNTGTLGPTIRYDDFGKGTFFDVGYPVRSTYARIFIINKNPITKKEMLGQ